MSETARRMLVRGVAAAQADDISEARRYLERALYHDADREQRARAHLWLSRIATDRDEQRDHLEEVLAADPTHGEAVRALAMLDGDLDPDEVVNPDRLPEPADATAQQIDARRMLCPQCGGSIRFEPGNSRVQCRYCGHRETLIDALKSQTSLREENFVLALATAKGHVVPEGLRSFACGGCQAVLLTSGEISSRCPYCGSPHVAEVKTEAGVAPEGIIPLVVDAEDAQAVFIAWLRDVFDDDRSRLAHVRTTRPRGVYLPLWTFDLMGEVGWRGIESDRNRNSSRSLITLDEGGIRLNGLGSGPHFAGSQVHEGVQYVLTDDTLVPGSHRVPYDLRECYDQLDLSRAVPYDPRFLSDWPAETYTIAPGDASLVARRRVLDEAGQAVRIKATVQVGELRNLQVYSKSLSVQSYKLLLAPMWLANYRHEDVAYTIVVNGQTGQVTGQRPPGRLRQALASILGQDT